MTAFRRAVFGLSLLVGACASAPVVCVLPEPPASLLTLPPPLPPVPADLPVRR